MIVIVAIFQLTLFSPTVATTQRALRGETRLEEFRRMQDEERRALPTSGAFDAGLIAALWVALEDYRQVMKPLGRSTAVLAREFAKDFGRVSIERTNGTARVLIFSPPMSMGGGMDYSVDLHSYEILSREAMR